MRADLLNQPVRLERVAGGFTKRTRSSGFRLCAVAVRLQNEAAMTGSRAAPDSFSQNEPPTV